MEISQQSLQQEFLNNQTEILADLAEFIAFKSISAEPEFKEDCRNCAVWLQNYLTKLGFNNSALIETEEHPLVYADFQVDPDLPTVLIYGHYDVQPVGNLDEWKTDPFTLSFNKDNFYARGAGDNKGQTFYVLHALKFLIATKKLNCNIKILVEGEEECGSASTIKILPSLKERLKADSFYICDAVTFAPNIPILAVGMRGIFAFRLKITGPRKVLHSGHFGGLAKNPATELCKVIASFFNQDGTIAIKDYYADYIEPEESEMDFFKYLPDLGPVEQNIDFKLKGTEQNIDPKISNFFRPTIELNGMISGYTEDGSKSIIPASAAANFTCRTVPNQDNNKLISLIKEHVEQYCSPEFKIECRIKEAGCAGVRLSNSNVNDYAISVFKSLYSAEPIVYSDAATIGVIPTIVETISENGFVTGFGLESDNWHAVNEKFSIDRFCQGYVFSGLYFSGYPKS